MAFSMLGLGLGFLYPSLGSYVSIPCLVVAGASYGMGVGPVANVLMSALFPQKIKSLGLAISNTMHALVLFGLVKMGHIRIWVALLNLRYSNIIIAGIPSSGPYSWDEGTLFHVSSSLSCWGCVQLPLDPHN